MKKAYFAKLAQGNTYNVGGFMFRFGIEIPVSEQMYNVLRGNPQFTCRVQEMADLSPEALGIPKVKPTSTPIVEPEPVVESETATEVISPKEEVITTTEIPKRRRRSEK